MKSKLLILLLFIISFTGHSQGLNAELGFNDNYDQYAKAVFCVGDFSYLIKFQKDTSSLSTSTLYKIDTAGAIIWNSRITPLPADYTEVYEMKPSEEGGVYILGYGLPVCDLRQECFWFIQKFDSAGKVIWTHSWLNKTCNIKTYLTGLSLNKNNEVLVNYIDNTSRSYVYTFNNNGLLKDSVKINQSQLSGFCGITGYKFIAYKGDSLSAFDTNGNSVYNHITNTTLQNVMSLNDTLYVLTADSVFIFDKNLKVLQGADVTSYSLYSNMKVTTNKIRFISNGVNEQTILELDKQLKLQNTISISITLNIDSYVDFSESHFSVAIDYPITLHHAIRFLDYSLKSTQNVAVNNTDIGVIDIDVTKSTTEPQGPLGVYQYQIWARVLVKNYGNKVLNSCRINHLITPYAICSEFFYTKEFSNLNLAPNDSVWIDLGRVDKNINFFKDTINVNLCIYTSHPNQLTDTIVANDQFYKKVYLGVVGLSEKLLQNISVYPNPVNEVLHIENPDLINLSVSVYNTLGKIISIHSGYNRNYSVDLSNQPKGLYLARIVTKDGEVTKKIIKQ
ncbi:MAG: T9SS type A sorting domain-containing protein [Bacteroidia bacterium]